MIPVSLGLDNDSYGGWFDVVLITTMGVLSSMQYSMCPSSTFREGMQFPDVLARPARPAW
jgi:hypothetical protein